MNTKKLGLIVANLLFVCAFCFTSYALAGDVGDVSSGLPRIY